MIFTESGLMLVLMFSVGPVAEANHLLVLVPVMAATIRLTLNSHGAAQRERWRPAAAAWGLFLLVTAAPLKGLTWANQGLDVLTGLMVLITGRVGLLLLAVAVVMAWTLVRERAATRDAAAPSRAELLAAC